MFWKKKTPQPPHSEPRRHHYDFAHRVVREVCTHDTLQFFAVIASPEQEQYLAWLWQLTEKSVGKPLSDVDPSGLKVITCRVKDAPTVIMQMPPTVADAEAHFVGVMLTNFQETADPPSQLTFRYFTLEQGSNLDGTARTVMCEWKDGSHINYGDGPPPAVEAFVEVIEKMA